MKLSFLKISSMVLTLIFNNDAKTMRKVVLEETKICVPIRVKFSVLTFLIIFAYNSLENGMIGVYNLPRHGDVSLILFP